MFAGTDEADLFSWLVKAYFSSRGLRYNLARLHMNSCDFSLENYAYVQEPSKELKDFDISR